jgi:ectoine hydroxylase-related dioxygenase (phytanoyl-CoA dioxygenase family)
MRFARAFFGGKTSALERRISAAARGARRAGTRQRKSRLASSLCNFAVYEPFADEEIFCDPDVLAIVENLVGQDFTMAQLATDTPLRGSDYQILHRDTPPLFPELNAETPSFQLAVNFPLVDVTEENGPFETTYGTHLMTKEEAMRRIEAGEIKLEKLMMKLGDLMIRDVRAIHRGTPNRTDEPRPMCVIGYSRRWLFRPEVSIRIPRQRGKIFQRKRNIFCVLIQRSSRSMKSIRRKFIRRLHTDFAGNERKFSRR